MVGKLRFSGHLMPLAVVGSVAGLRAKTSDEVNQKFAYRTVGKSITPACAA
jgi:hypothetical protein